MERLSSCYFCGTAVDAPLEEYPVVPRDLDPDDDQQATVTLCPTCRRKLATVVGTVLDAAGSPVDAEVADTGPPAAGLDDSGQDIGSDAGDGTAGAAETAEVENDPAGTDAADVEPDGADAVEAEGMDAGVDTGDDGDEGEGADLPNEGEGDEGDGEDEGDVLDGLSVSALEYNRVMRLLGNREFPVDRSEFEMVATNAYEVTPEQVDAIIDAAIQRGLIAQEGDQLVRTD